MRFIGPSRRRGKRLRVMKLRKGLRRGTRTWNYKLVKKRRKAMLRVAQPAKRPEVWGGWCFG